MEASTHSYEDIRRKRIEKNLKQLEDLGIARISKSLLEVAKRESKQLKIHTIFKAKKLLETSELRRSSRMQKEAPSYCDDVVDSGKRRLHCRRSCKSESIGREYTGRIASYEEKVFALKRAELLLNQVSSDHPSFVKSMLRSHVSSCFWLGLPTKFCRDHLPLCETKMILEDEEGEEHEAIYIGRRTGLSGGWRSFAVDHKLEDGDALVFKLIELTRFKKPDFSQGTTMDWQGAPASPSSQFVKKILRLEIPVDNYPNFNFVGRLLGPRGNSLKRVEASTGCRVFIRGKGSIKDPGKEEKLMGRPGYEHLNDPLHVLIEAELPAHIVDLKLRHAQEILEELLKPVEESHDYYKRQQLRELAILNSGLREDSPHPSGSVSPFNSSGLKRPKTGR